MSQWWCIGALLVFGAIACKDKSGEPEDLGYDYFPVETGHWVEYKVDSIVYDPFNQSIDTFQFFLREEIAGEFQDLEGRSTLRIERFKRENDTLAWRLIDVWTANRTSTTAERVEENERIVKLSFPVRLNQQWNGNAFNLRPEEDFEYTQVDASATVNGNTFAQTLTVLQFDNSNLIEREYSLERYSREVGLIYKELTLLDLQRDSGLDLRMEYRAYGN